jgi:hypothetical protein
MSIFSNKEGATDHVAQRKALVAKLHHEFDGELNKVQQHIADITHQCKQCGIVNDFVYIIKENSQPSHLDLSNLKEKALWDQDPARFVLGNLLDDPSKATLENIQQVRDLIWATTISLHTKPKAGSTESDHLTSFQNRMWFYDLLLSSWTPNMLSTMSKYLENHDGDGVFLYYCFLKHFAGATKANIIAAYADLTEAEVQLNLHDNNVSAFTNAIQIPTHQLANCQQQPTFQHMLNVYHGVMDCPNTEFSNYVNSLYRKYRTEGPASTWTMFQLLDNLDLEYTRLKSLNRWDKQPAKNSEIIALTAELSFLKAYIAKLQKVPSQDSGTIRKPTQPPKEGEEETTTINGITWHYCQKCFSGKGSWNKMHTTAEHVKGAGRGYKGGKDPPVLLHQKRPVLLAHLVLLIWLLALNLREITIPEDYFLYKAGLYAMLALSPLLSHLFTQVIAFFMSFFLYTKPTHRLCSYLDTSITPPLTFCDEKLGVFYNCVMFYYFFRVRLNFYIITKPLFYKCY